MMSIQFIFFILLPFSLVALIKCEVNVFSSCSKDENTLSVKSTPNINVSVHIAFERQISGDQVSINKLPLEYFNHYSFSPPHRLFGHPIVG